MAATWALEASWRSLGGFLELLPRLVRLRGGFQGLMGRSWKAPGRSWTALARYRADPRRPWGGSGRVLKRPGRAHEGSFGNLLGKLTPKGGRQPIFKNVGSI